MMKSWSGSFTSTVIAVFFGVMVLLSPLAPAWAEEEMNLTSVSENGEALAVDAAAVTEEHHASEENLGFPQLKTDTYASQVFWLFIAFGLMYALMSKVALPRIGNVIDMRQSHKNLNLARAAEMSGTAEKIKTEYEVALAEAHEEARKLLASATEEITTRASAESARFGEHARTRIAAAEQAITRAKQDAISSLSDISGEIAADIVNKITGAQVTKAEAKKVATAMMEKQ